MTIPSKAKGDGMSAKLLPCPFCGGEATVGSNRNEGTAWVSCGSCQAQSGGFQDFGVAIHLLEASAADEWNRRHPHSSKPVEVTA